MEPLTTNIIDFCAEHWLALTLCAVIVILVALLERTRRQRDDWQDTAEHWAESYEYFQRKWGNRPE